MSAIIHDVVTVGGTRIHFAEMGTGPAVIFCHGFPELWISWRKQMVALAEAGYCAIALDMRGHGESDAPLDVGAYDVLHMVGDVVAILDKRGIERAIMVGHDAGTTTAYHMALMRPDRVRGVVGLSVPYIPRGNASLIEALRISAPPGFYMHYFQEEGVAETEFETDVSMSLRRLFYANSGEFPDGPITMIVPEGGQLCDTLPQPQPMRFMSEATLAEYAAAYRRTGFRGGLNGYRVFQRNWDLTAPWHGMRLPVPACYIGGDKDTVLHFPGFRKAAEAMDDVTILGGAGHWIQAERPDEVNDMMLGFIKALPS